MRRSVRTLVALVALSASVGCSSAPSAPALQGGSEGGPRPPAPDGGPAPSGEAGPIKDNAPPPAKEAPKPDPDKITESYGIFVSRAGSEGGEGTRRSPLGSIQDGIARAKAEKKSHVFVCEGTYDEALVLADGVSIGGNFDCSAPEWKLVPDKRSTLRSPTSPALRADDIVTPTRVDGFVVMAPDATTPSGSSIAVIAVDSNALTFASGRIQAGAGVKGDDGVEGEQLRSVVTRPPQASVPSTPCFEQAGDVTRSCTLYSGPRSDTGRGGESACLRADGSVVSTSTGGMGGSSGLYTYNSSTRAWTAVNFQFYGNGSPGTGAGTNGVNGASGAAGQLGAEGFVPGHGVPGTAGSVGQGGRGGHGAEPLGSLPGFSWGKAGAGGGAGGCQGQSGTAGSGGGASVAVLAIRSPLRFDSMEVQAGPGGAGGRGTFGSEPTVGSSSGDGVTINGGLLPSSPLAFPGGAGGLAGVSGHGAGGPSFGIAHQGLAPILAQTSPRAGVGGAGVPQVQKTVGLGVTRVIPAAPGGTSEAIHPF